jgi:hypothetical protein
MKGEVCRGGECGLSDIFDCGRPVTETARDVGSQANPASRRFRTGVWGKRLPIARHFGYVPLSLGENSLPLRLPFRSQRCVNILEEAQAWSA